MPRSSRIDKILYLVNHPELLTAPRKKIIDALVAAGLASPKTSAVDLGPDRLRDAARLIIQQRKMKPGETL